jgi:hypothetical protein
MISGDVERPKRIAEWPRGDCLGMVLRIENHRDERAREKYEALDGWTLKKFFHGKIGTRYSKIKSRRGDRTRAGIEASGRSGCPAHDAIRLD